MSRDSRRPAVRALKSCFAALRRFFKQNMPNPSKARTSSPPMQPAMMGTMFGPVLGDVTCEPGETSALAAEISAVPLLVPPGTVAPQIPLTAVEAWAAGLRLAPSDAAGPAGKALERTPWVLAGGMVE